MLRKTAILTLCLAATLIACEKKEPEPAAGAPVVRREVKSPPGMVPIRGMQSVYISELPLTVGEYVAYLKGTQQPVPARWQAATADSPEAALPVTGVGRQQAEWCATWHLKRLPTVQEWRQAGTVVGAKPYPWTEEGDAVGAEVLLVREGRAGPEEQAARNGLAEVILADYREQVADLQGQARTALDAERRRRDDQWKRIKPAFFALLDQEGGLAAERARQESVQMALRMFGRLALDKAELAVALKTTEMSQQDAKTRIAQYREATAKLRTDVQRVQGQLRKDTQAAQEEVLKLTKAFEDSGLAQATGGLAEADAALAAADDVQNIAQAVEARDALSAALLRLAEPGPAFAGIPSRDELATRAEAINAELATLAAEAPAPNSMDEVQETLDRFGKVIGEEFDQERSLARDLVALVEQRSSKKAVEAKLAVLQAAMP